MEILKKDILKEMEEKSIENLNKGIDMTVSILKNEFPFVTGWKYKHDPDFFNSTVYIILICDMDKSSEFYNSPIKDYYKNLEADVTYPFSPLEMSIEMDNEEKYELYKEIQKSLDETYYEIPNDYRHTFKSYILNTDTPKEIYIDGFVFPAPEKLSESEYGNDKVSLAKSLIQQLFDEVSFIEQSTYNDRPLLTVYFDSDDTAANIESVFTHEICDTVKDYTSGEIKCNPSWGPEWRTLRNNPDILIDAILLEYDDEGNILNEDYSPAGKEVTPNEIVVHKANPIFRDRILEQGLKVRAGECYRIYVGYGEKCIPAIFATNSTNKRAWFDSTYDDDVWFIDTTMIPDVKWYKDRHFESTKKHIVTFENIPPEALTLKYEGTGKGDEFLVKENVDDIEKNLKVIKTILSQVSWDGLCDIWVEYNPIDKDYEIRSKSTIRPYDHDEIIKDLDYIDNALRSMGLSVYIYTPWYVDSCEDEVKFLNESKEKSKKDLIEKVLNDLVLPQYEHVICGFELKNVDDESLNNVINYPGVTVTFIGGYGTKMWPQTQAVQKMYDDVLDDIWETVWDYTGISLELYSKYVRDCGKKNIYLREQKEETNYIPIIEEIIEPFKNEDCVCEINVWYDEEDDMYSVYLVLGTEELNGKFYYVDGIRTYRNKLARKIETEIKSYLPIDNLYVGSYGKPNCGWKPLNENWFKVPSSDYNSLEKIINLEMKEKYSWWKDIKINTLNYIELYGDVQIEAELTVDEEWGANQWREWYYNTKFPGNEGWEDEYGYSRRVSLGDITDSTYAEVIRDNLREILRYTLNIDVNNMSFRNVYLIFE